MFGWLSTPKCPVDAATRRWIDNRWAWLEEAFGRERPMKSQVVLAQPKFFPDPFAHTKEDARLLLDRVCGYMGIDPAACELFFYEDRNPVHVGRFRQGTGGLYHEAGGKYQIWIESSSLSDPLGLVATMAHEVGHVHLIGHGRVSEEVEDHEPLTDLLTVFLGMGVITANSVIHEKHWHEGQMSGWSVGRRGYLSMPKYGYALALFARARGESRPKWASQLRTDVRSAFWQAMRFLDEEGQPQPELPESQNKDSLPPVRTDSDGAAAKGEVSADDEISGASLNAQQLLRRYARGQRDFGNVRIVAGSFSYADLRDCNFARADFSAADFNDANLSNSDLSEAEFEGAMLSNCNLRDCKLRGADFSNADLSGTDLANSDIRGASFTRANLRQTIFTGTIRDRSTDLSYEDLSEVVCDVDLTAEDMRGTSRNDAFYERASGVARIWSLLAVVVLASGAGFFMGMLAGLAIDEHLAGSFATIGAVGAGAWVLIMVLWPRARVPRD